MVRVKKFVLYPKRPEKLIRKLALDELALTGWHAWYPPKPRFSATDADIFGAYDIAAWKANNIRFIQITTQENIGARTEKIRNILRTNQLTVPLHISSEVWGLAKDGGWKVAIVR